MYYHPGTSQRGPGILSDGHAIIHRPAFHSSKTLLSLRVPRFNHTLFIIPSWKIQCSHYCMHVKVTLDEGRDTLCSARMFSVSPRIGNLTLVLGEKSRFAV